MVFTTALISSQIKPPIEKMIRHIATSATLKDSQFHVLFDEFSLRLWSTAKWYGFERDLSVTLESRSPRIQVRIRELRKDDIAVLLNLSDAEDKKAVKDRLIRLSMVRAEIPTCYVAVTNEGVPCHMQWMISSDANSKLRRFTRKGLPTIKENEVLLENAFTLERYQRQGIEIETVRCLFQLAQEKGVKRAILFVSDQNLISLKLVSKLGFIPFCIKTSTRRLFLRNFTFEQVPREATQR
jgi:GNAT superfamily N-acetyltransferase